jgi:hypothetical protein
MRGVGVYRCLSVSTLQAGRHGAVLKAVREGLSTATSAYDTDLVALRGSALAALGWTHASALDEERAPVESPGSYALF